MNEKQISFYAKLRIILITSVIVLLVFHVINYFNNRLIEAEDFISAAILLLNLIYLIFYRPNKNDKSGPEIILPWF